MQTFILFTLSVFFAAGVLLITVYYLAGLYSSFRPSRTADELQLLVGLIVDRILTFFRLP